MTLLCYICLDSPSAPISLPCGHIFCTDCIVQTAQAIEPNSTLHKCPACRAIYAATPVDPARVPAQLRPYVTPSIRRIYLEQPFADSERTNSSASKTQAQEIARLRAENAALRNSCGVWRRRAELHSAATLKLLELARVTRDQAVQLAREKNSIEDHYQVLKRKFDCDDDPPFSITTKKKSQIAAMSSSSPLDIQKKSFSVESSSPGSHPEIEEDHLQPPRKRVKREHFAPDRYPDSES